MGLAKEYTLETGVTGSYWKVVDFNGGPRTGALGIMFGLYVNRQYAAKALESSTCLFYKSIYLEGQDMIDFLCGAYGTNIIESAYNLAKEKGQFLFGATDVIEL